MPRSTLSAVLATAALISLSACATVPAKSPLMAGIDKAELGKAVPGGLRAAADPVCVNLYNNMANYVPAAKKPNTGGRFLQAMALNVLTSAATGGIVSGIGSPVAQYAASAAVGTASNTAGNAAINAVSKPTPLDVQKQKAAEALSCPMPTGLALQNKVDA